MAFTKPNTIGPKWEPRTGKEIDENFDKIFRALRTVEAAPAAFSFGGSLSEFVQSPTPTWVAANARRVRIDGGAVGGGGMTLTVRIRADSGTVTARLQDVTNGVTAGTSNAVAASSYGTEVIAITLSPGVADYEVQLLPSVANSDVNLGSAYMG